MPTVTLQSTEGSCRTNLGALSFSIGTLGFMARKFPAALATLPNHGTFCALDAVPRMVLTSREYHRDQGSDHWTAKSTGRSNPQLDQNRVSDLAPLIKDPPLELEEIGVDVHPVAGILAVRGFQVLSLERA